jgi:hypothetical protein
VPLQLAKQRGRRSCAGLRVTVRRHLTGAHTVWRGPQCLGLYDAQGQPLPGARPRPLKPLRAPRRLRGAPHLTKPGPHSLQDRERRGRPYPETPRKPACQRRRPGPRLPVGPGD